MNINASILIEYIDIRVHESNIERDFVLTFYKSLKAGQWKFVRASRI